MKKLIYSMLMTAMTLFVLTCCEDVPAPYDTPTSADDESTTSSEATGDGTLDSPFNCVAANEVGEALSTGSTTDDYYYIKGIVYSVSEEFSSSYGNATFYISDDGTSTDKFYCYRVYYLNNQKWTESDPQIEAGDTVIIYAKIMNYSGTVETAQSYGYVYSHNGDTGGASESTGEASGSGTVDDPYNCVAANEIGSALSTGSTTDDYYYIKGTIVSISESFTSSYGNATFYISDDGTTTDQFYCYRIYYFNNQSWTTGDTQIAVGDEVVVCAKIMNYYGTAETAQYYGYLYSLNGSTGSDSESSSSSATGSGTVDDPYNCVAANEIGSALSTGSTSDDYYYIQGKIVSITEEFTSSYGNATFYISDDGTTTDQFYCYRVYYLNNEKWTTGDTQIAVGDEVVVYAKIMNYYGTPETAQYYGYLYSINSSSSDSDDSSTDDDDDSSDSGVTTTDSYTSFTAEGLGLDNAEELTTIDLGDGTTLTFSVGSGSTTPKYYSNGTNLRMYPGNTMTMSSSKTIASVVITCDEVSSVICNASEDVTASTGTVSFSDVYINVSGINSTSTVITNASSSTGTASQVRIVSMTIYYAD